jgi:hypothetical protein
MRSLKLIGVALFLAANAALAGSPGPNLYAEDDEAGPRSSPQDVTASQGTLSAPWSGFSGDLGDCIDSDIETGDCLQKDTADAFRFYFEGGSFVMDFSIDDPLSESQVTRELYLAGDIGTALSHTGDDWGMLAAGNYIFELTVDLTAEELAALTDPPFTISLIDGNGGFPLLINAPQEAPAPGALALLLAGLAGLGLARRRARTA